MSGEIDKSPLGILAGEGELPIQLTQYCIDNNIPVFVVQFDRCMYNEFPNVKTLKTRIERVGSIFKFLYQNKVKNVVMIGNLNRPQMASLRPDMKGLKTLGKIAGAFLKGDDNLLRPLRTEIEIEGFNVKGINHYLTNLTANTGLLTQNRCTRPVNDAISEALRYGADDKGQSILLHTDDTYSYETRNGTTALIANKGKKGSILIKMVKPQQDLDLDRPTVGLNTLKALHDRGCQGMILQANGVLLVNKHDMVEFANNHGLFIEAVNVNDT